MNKSSKKIFCYVLLLFFVPKAYFSQDLKKLPPLTSTVTDQAGLLTLSQKSQLERLLQNFSREKGSQVVLLIVPSVKPESIEGYSIRLADAWKIGRKKIDDGVILIVALKDRKVRIEVGYGLEGALPDIIAHQIIQNAILPQFRTNLYFEGILAGLENILLVVSGEDLPPAIKQKRNPSSSQKQLGKILFFLILLAFSSFLLRSILGVGLAFVFNIILGVLLGYFFFSWFSGLFLGLLASLFSTSRGMSTLGMMGYGSAMGMGMGRGFGGGSGGFGGGGGSFGGGGSSGSW